MNKDKIEADTTADTKSHQMNGETDAVPRDTTKNRPKPKNKAGPLNAKVPSDHAKCNAVPRMAPNCRPMPRTTAKSKTLVGTLTSPRGGPVAALHLYPRGSKG